MSRQSSPLELLSKGLELTINSAHLLDMIRALKNNTQEVSLSLSMKSCLFVLGDIEESSHPLSSTHLHYGVCDYLPLD